MTSKSGAGRCVSSENNGRRAVRSCAAMSGQGVYERSATASSRSFNTSQRIWMPWLGRPISYVSGYITSHDTLWGAWVGTA